MRDGPGLGADRAARAWRGRGVAAAAGWDDSGGRGGSGRWDDSGWARATRKIAAGEEEAKR
ncbi:MAG: hypothetical protein D6775_08150 [Caldilineae bacterium]|nr:MAG: hypothetical protein D6775_08150 [Caldilineae bacterium]